jgi:hypothetical protein
MALLCAAPAHGAIDWDTPVRANCNYYNVKTDTLLDQHCTMRGALDGQRILVQYIIGQRKFTFVLKDRQGPFVLWTWDGKPAVEYEENRETLHYSTLDLKESLDVTLGR